MVDIYFGDLGEDVLRLAELTCARVRAASPMPKDTGEVIPIAIEAAADEFPELDEYDRLKMAAAVVIRLNAGMRRHRLSVN